MKKLAIAMGSLATAIAPAAFGQYYGDSWRGDRYRGEARVGYDVRYVYNGREFRTRLDRDPGQFLRVAVNVEPREGETLPPGPPPRRPNR